MASDHAVVLAIHLDSAQQEWLEPVEELLINLFNGQRNTRRDDDVAIGV